MDFRFATHSRGYRGFDGFPCQQTVKEMERTDRFQWNDVPSRCRCFTWCKQLATHKHYGGFPLIPRRFSCYRAFSFQYDACSETSTEKEPETSHFKWKRSARQPGMCCADELACVYYAGAKVAPSLQSIFVSVAHQATKMFQFAFVFT